MKICLKAYLNCLLNNWCDFGQTQMSELTQSDFGVLTFLNNIFTQISIRSLLILRYSM